jgi:hypothetical protein
MQIPGMRLSPSPKPSYNYDLPSARRADAKDSGRGNNTYANNNTSGNYMGNDDVAVGGQNNNNYEEEEDYNADNTYASPQRGGPVDDSDRAIRPKQKLVYDDADPTLGEVDDNPKEQFQFPRGEHPLEGVDNLEELPNPEELTSKSR